MSSKTAVFFAALLVFVFLGTGLAGDQDAGRGRVMPDEAFAAIVQEARQTIRSTLQKGEPRSTYFNVRVNALVIAMAADNRLARRDADRSAGELRDAALNLSEGLQMHYVGPDWVIRLASLNTSDNRAIHAELAKRFAALERVAEQKSDTKAKPDRIRLSSRFTHEDLAFFFGGCGGHSGHKIESELLKLTEAGKVQVLEQMPAIERMGYKIALAGELLRDFEAHADVFRGGSPDKRKMWIGLARDLEQTAWELADSARTKQVEPVRTAVNRVNRACIACHEKAGFRNSQ